MSRTLCADCSRPEKACICQFVQHIENNIHVIVLQHPSEVSQTKGTVGLLSQSLNHCDVVIGESFVENFDLQTLLKPYQGVTALLYPSDNAHIIDFDKHEVVDNSSINDVRCLIILDGTWKKAYRMFMLNAFLHHLPHLTLPSGIESGYQIRKTKKENALSSLEACCHALLRLENSVDKYQSLLDNFSTFNQFQLSFRPDNKSTNCRRCE